MFKQQHNLVDLVELQQNNEGFQFQQQEQQQGQHLSIGNSRNVVDPNLYHDLVEFFPLVQSYLRKIEHPSFLSNIYYDSSSFDASTILSRSKRDRQMEVKVGSSTKKSTGGDDKTMFSRYFVEEDYIVFCFEKNVVEDDAEPQGLNCVDCKLTMHSQKSVNRKLHYGDHVNIEKDSSRMHDEVVIYEDGSLINPTNPNTIVSEQEDGVSRTGSFYDSTHWGHIDDSDEYATVSAESASSSNQSDNSGGSFAFPVLGLEWKGSPEQMPKSKVIHVKKKKVWFLPFHCFCFSDAK